MDSKGNKKTTGGGTGCLTSILAVLLVMLVICGGGIVWKIMNVSSVNVESAEKQSEKNRVANDMLNEEYEAEEMPVEATKVEEPKSEEQQNIQKEKNVDDQISGSNANLQEHNYPLSQENISGYVLNTHTKKIHYQDCADVKKIAEKNYSLSNETREELLAQGYTECGHCMR